MTKHLPPFLLVVLFALSFLAPSWTGGVGPGALGAASVVGPPPGPFVAWFTADVGFVPSGVGISSWTDQSPSHHVWPGNGACPGLTTLNGHAAVSFPVAAGKCNFTSDLGANQYFTASCWAIGAIYTYSGTDCGTSCPTLSTTSPPILTDEWNQEELLVGDLTSNSAALAGYTRLAGSPFAAYAQVDGPALSTQKPHYAFTVACSGNLTACLDGVCTAPVPIGAMNLSPALLSIATNPGYIPTFYGALRTLVLYGASPPSPSTFNSWAKTYGGF